MVAATSHSEHLSDISNRYCQCVLAQYDTRVMWESKNYRESAF
jgi:hypothetical protein